jgi:erythromycin esterase
VHFYGLDLTGGQDIGVMPGAAGSVTAALAYLNQLAPGADSGLGAHIRPLMTRFLPDSYPTLTLADRELLKTALARLHHILATDSARLLRVSSPIAYARALRNAWMAVRLNDMMAAGITDSAGMTHAIVAARDSTMAENALWVLAQAGQHGRVVVFAHNAHVMNAGMFNDGARNRLGQFLRAWLDTNLVILGAATGAIVGGPGGGDGWIGHDPEAHADSASFAAVLASAGLPTFVLDRRTGERIPVVAAALSKPWKLMFVSPDVPYQAVVPHDAFDAIVYFDRVTPAKMRPGP